MFKFNKGRVKVGTTLWFNLFGSLEVPLNKHRLDRATVWIEAKLRLRNFSVLNKPLSHQFSQNVGVQSIQSPTHSQHAVVVGIKLRAFIINS
jgi:hypothetical protein